MQARNYDKSVLVHDKFNRGFFFVVHLLCKYILLNQTATLYLRVISLCVSGTIPVAGDKYTISVFDTAGQQDYEGLRVFTYGHSEVIIVCFSVQDRKSFNNVKEFWVPEIRANVGNKANIILVATQTDTKDVSKETVTEDEASELAESIGAVCYLECSAKDGHGINDLFESVVLSAMRGRKRKLSILKKLFGK